MQCEEARRLLRKGEDHQAEAHLETCRSCFVALEDEDPVVRLLRAARPAPVEAPPAVAGRVLERWGSERISLPLGFAAAVALALLALAMVGLAILTAPELTGSLVGRAAIALNTGAAIVLALVAGPRALLLGNPSVLAGYALLTVSACALWLRLYQQVLSQRRRVIR